MHVCHQVEDAQRWRVVLQLLGLRTQGLAAAAVVPVVLTAVLFVGPLSIPFLAWLSQRPIAQLSRSLLEVSSRAAEQYSAVLWRQNTSCSVLYRALWQGCLVKPTLQWSSLPRACVAVVQWWRGVAVGPLTEEFAFRACMLPLLLLQVVHPPAGTAAYPDAVL